MSVSKCLSLVSGLSAGGQYVRRRPTQGDRRPARRLPGRCRQEIRGVVFPGFGSFGSPRHETGRTHAPACDPSAKPRCPCIARMEGLSGGRLHGGLRLRGGRGRRCHSWEVIRVGAALSDHRTRLGARGCWRPVGDGQPLSFHVFGYKGTGLLPANTRCEVTRLAGPVLLLADGGRQRRMLWDTQSMIRRPRIGVCGTWAGCSAPSAAGGRGPGTILDSTGQWTGAQSAPNLVARAGGIKPSCGMTASTSA